MKLIPFCCLCFLFASCINQAATEYEKDMDAYRNAYLQGFLEEERSPLLEEDFEFIRFYKSDVSYRISAEYELLIDQVPFDLKTSSNKIKQYRKFALLKFNVKEIPDSLFVYESMALKEIEEYKDYLFLPFTDETNGLTSYGGGRYLDLYRNDFMNGFVEIDFNKCYNPWCAYSDGFNCPVPPLENDLRIAIEAGEQNFSGIFKYAEDKQQQQQQQQH